MKKISSISWLIVLMLVSGCWDRNEINDYAFWIGTALDLSEDGNLEKSAQIAVPAGFKSTGRGGSDQRGNIVVTASGSSVVDLEQQVQDKLPRRIFLGHRRAIFIGESLARKGIVSIMDQFTRNTDTRLRTDIFVVNNGKGRDVLEVNSPFNKFSSIVAVDQDRFCRLGDTALRDVLLDIGRDGIRPSMPMVEITARNKQEKNQIIEVKSVAIFNQYLQMVGKVTGRESLELFWMKGVLKDQFITEETESGNIALYESNLKKSIHTEINGDRIKAHVKLEGIGRVIENNTDIDISDTPQRVALERTLDTMKAKQIEATVKKLQGQYGQDVFGIGEEIHREHPYQWKKLRKNWDQLFPSVEVTVTVKLKIENMGGIGKRIPGIGAKE
ncbi:Ger(x)C family spore germination protein [Paenibacillus glycanilyticus]|uniref:Ger(x)C family spore germination protein n=1 Tax=Paenibacillus glycanilyticus TaxID=126569 RepID=UPI00203A7234|nr:Ger(x)C family spore germination protein [Paenibacillus glycanilyticus]MCM3629896.1 Ger(x)C family spore germination protein [Paenibacillus glycanilyticus]